jgi:hypothetical protein
MRAAHTVSPPTRSPLGQAQWYPVRDMNTGSCTRPKMDDTTLVSHPEGVIDMGSAAGTVRPGSFSGAASTSTPRTRRTIAVL